MGNLCAKPKENLAEGSNMNLENSPDVTKAKSGVTVKETVNKYNKSKGKPKFEA